MTVLVNPNKGLGNSPDVTIITTERQIKPTWRNPLYFKAGPCYFHQDRQTGYTQFLFHHGALHRTDELGVQQLVVAPGKGHYHTDDGGGFGGELFRLKVFGIGNVNLRGPWSGGCYCANKFLHKHVTSVNIHSGRKRDYAFQGSYYTVDTVNTWLAGTGWKIERNTEPRFMTKDEYWYEPTYNGEFKKTFSTSLMEELDAKYQKATAQRLRMMRGY